jgi:hypothetical protein
VPPPLKPTRPLEEQPANTDNAAATAVTQTTERKQGRVIAFTVFLLNAKTFAPPGLAARPCAPLFRLALQLLCALADVQRNRKQWLTPSIEREKFTLPRQTSPNSSRIHPRTKPHLSHVINYFYPIK